MNRWFTNLPVTRKLLLGLCSISPLVLGMIIIDVILSIQQAGVIVRIAHAPSPE